MPKKSGNVGLRLTPAPVPREPIDMFEDGLLLGRALLRVLRSARLRCEVELAGWCEETESDEFMSASVTAGYTCGD